MLRAFVLAGLLLPGSPLQAEQTPFIGGTYEVSGSQKVVTTGVRRPVAGRLIIDQVGSDFRVTFDMRGMVRTPEGNRHVQWTGRGDGVVEGDRIQGTIASQSVSQPTSAAVPFVPRELGPVVSTEFLGTITPEGTLSIEMNYDADQRGVVDPLHVEVTAIPVPHLAPVATAPRRSTAAAALQNDVGLLRMLSQRSVRELIQAKLAIETPATAAEETDAEFAGVMSRVRKRAETQPAERRKQIDPRLAAVEKTWGSLRSTRDADKADAFADQFVSETDGLAALFDLECAEVRRPVCALAIGDIGRQRMVVERMAKEALFAVHDPDPVRAELSSASRAEFETTLGLLRTRVNGLDPDDRDEFQEQLQSIELRWSQYAPAVDGLASAGAVDPAKLSNLIVAESRLIRAIDRFITRAALSASR